MIGLGLGLGLSGPAGAASPPDPGIDPLTLFAGGAAGFLFDFTDAASLYADTSLTTPIEGLGSAPAGIADLSGNDNHATQSTEGSRALYAASRHGLNGMRFDGSDDFYSLVSTTFDSSDSEITIIGCVAAEPFNGAAAIYSETNSGSNHRVAVWSSLGGSTADVDGEKATKLHLGVRGASNSIVYDTGAYFADRNVRTFAARMMTDGGQSRYFRPFLDGRTLDGTFGSGAITVNGASIGAALYPSAAQFFTGHMFGLMAIGDGLDDETVLGVMRWFAIQNLAPRVADGDGSNTKTPNMQLIGGRRIISTVPRAHGIRLTDMTPVSVSRPFAGPAFSLRKLGGLGDNHSAASLLHMPDGKILTASTQHNQADLAIRLSSEANSILAWGDLDVQTAHALAKADYPSLVIMDDHVYCFMRGYDPETETTDDEDPWFSKLPLPYEDGADFPPATKAISGNSDERIYRLIHQFEPNNIGLLMTNDNPADSAVNSVYFVWFRAEDGEEWMEDLAGNILPLGTEISTMTPIYDSSASGKRAWIIDLTNDDDGHPCGIFIVYDSTSGRGAHSYWYWRWTGTQSVISKICDAGPSPNASSPYPFAGAAIDPRSPRGVVVVSRSVDEGDSYQVWRFTSDDDGETWDSGIQLTESTEGLGAIKPQFWPLGTSEPRLNYKVGTQASYSDYQLTVMQCHSVTGEVM